MSVTKFCLWFVFIAFFFLLTKNILFKKNPRYYKRYFRSEYRYYSVKKGWENSNTKPFYTIKSFYNSRRLNTEYKQDNLLGNLLGFVPIGFLLPLLMLRLRKGIHVLLAGFFLSLCFEITQLLFGLGIFDVDDIILNTSGCFAGYFLWWLASRILYLRKQKTFADIKIQNRNH